MGGVFIVGRCGCTAVATCDCVLVGDETTTSVVGNGGIIAPYEVSILAYPRPRPFLYLTRTASTAVLAADTPPISPPIVFQTALYITDPLMWNGSTRMIAKVAGTYLVTAGSGDGWGASPIIGTTAIVQNGTTMRSNSSQVWNTSGGPFLTTTLVRMAINDTLELQVNVNADTTLINAYMIVRWMGF